MLRVLDGRGGKGTAIHWALSALKPLWDNGFSIVPG